MMSRALKNKENITILHRLSIELVINMINDNSSSYWLKSEVTIEDNLIFGWGQYWLRSEDMIEDNVIIDWGHELGHYWLRNVDMIEDNVILIEDMNKDIVVVQWPESSVIDS